MSKKYNESVQKISAKIESNTNKIIEYKNAKSTTSKELSVLRKKMSKTPSSKDETMMTQLMTMKDKLSERIDKLKEECKTYEKSMKKTLKVKHKGGIGKDPEIKDAKINVATWNILADGLAIKEFMSKDGTTDDTNLMWNIRGPKIANVINELLFDKKFQFHIVATQENDHPIDLFNSLKKKNQSIGYIFVPKYRNKDGSYSSTPTKLEKSAFKLKIGRTKPENNFDDCLAIYYDSTKVKPIISDNETYVKSIVMDEEKHTCCGLVKFKYLENTKEDITFNVINAHLTSGEDATNAEKRVTEINKILDYLNTHKSKDKNIILMDSNSSHLYPYPDNNIYDVCNIDKTLKNNGYHNIIRKSSALNGGEKHNECLKMRHAVGDQPAKFCDFMFDTIDKIVVNEKNDKSKPIGLTNLQAFKRYDLQYYDKFTSMRLEANRNRIKDECFGNFNFSKGYHYDQSQIEKILEKKFEAIINEEKEILTELTNNLYIKDHWGSDGKPTLEPTQLKLKFDNPKDYKVLKAILFKGSTVSLFKKYAPNFPPIEYEKKQKLFLEKIDIIKNSLYPNNEAPSDHPPCAATILLKEAPEQKQFYHPTPNNHRSN